MNKSNFLIIGLFSILLYFPIAAMAENSSVTEHGFVGMDSTIYVVEKDKSTLVKVSGIGDVPQGVDHERATIIITLPDETTSNHRLFSTGDGYFELIFPLGYDSQIGTYKVFVTFAGQILGELYFEVQREDPFIYTKDDDSEEDHSFPFKITSTYFETDSEYYEKGDDIHISGTVSKVTGSAVAIRVYDSRSNMITVDQLKPKSDGTFSTTIKTNGNTWKFEGDYTIKSTYDNEKMSTFFEFGIPKTVNNIPNPITQSGESNYIGKDCSDVEKNRNYGDCRTYLNLDWKLQDSMFVPSTSIVHLYGNLKMESGTYGMMMPQTYIDPFTGKSTQVQKVGWTFRDVAVPNERINIINVDSGSIITTVQTNNDGTFSTFQKVTPGNSYKIQAVYEGSNVYQSSKSSEYRVVVPSPTPPTPPTPPPVQPQSTSNPFDPTGIIVVVILSVIIGIVVIALKRRKPTSNRPQAPRATSTYRPPTNPNPPGNTESSTMFFYECPKCHGADIQNNPDGSVSCPDCGFRG